MGCLSGLTKYILFIFNFIIAIAALCLIIFGAIVIVNNSPGVDGYNAFTIGGFAVAIGVIIFLVAFFGCCGAIQENSCMLTTYAVILICLFILQIVLGVLAFVAIKNDNNQLYHYFQTSTKKIFDQSTNDPDGKRLVNELQKELQCCGVDGPAFWQLILPDSCCPQGFGCTIITSYQKGCAQALLDVFVANMKTIGAVALAFAVVELLGAIFACVVRNRRS